LFGFVLLALGAACGPAPVRVPPHPGGSAGAGSAGAGFDAGMPVVELAAGGPVDASRMDAAIRPTVDASDAVVVDSSVDRGAPDRPPAAAPRAGELLIDEALANPNGSDLGKEWVEIVSVADIALDLTALHLSDATTDVAIGAGTIAPGARLVLGQSADPAKNGGAAVDVAYGTRLILNNDAEQLSICVGPCATGAVIDHVSWSGLAAAYDGHALTFERDVGGAIICPAELPFGSNGDFGTPGAANPPCPTTDGGPPASVDSGADLSAHADAASDR